MHKLADGMQIQFETSRWVGMRCTTTCTDRHTDCLTYSYPFCMTVLMHACSCSSPKDCRYAIAGQSGLEVCSGLTTDRKKAQEAQWVSFDPVPGAITINIGDSLQYWSDGALKSTYHRVRCPAEGEYAVSPLCCVHTQTHRWSDVLPS